jgi:hypothetical protein
MSELESQQAAVEHTPHTSSDPLGSEIGAAAEALLALAESSPTLARQLARLTQAVAVEAARTQRFARALSRAIEEPAPAQASTPDRSALRKKSNRRNPGIKDPFAVFAERGEAGLREQLATMNIEQLRDIIAEHGMDRDRLAMKWKDAQRVADRIVDRVAARATKGSAFRSRPNQHDIV